MELPYSNLKTDLQVIEAIKRGALPVPSHKNRISNNSGPTDGRDPDLLAEFYTMAREHWHQLTDAPPFDKPRDIRLWGLCKQCWTPDPDARVPVYTLINYLQNLDKAGCASGNKITFDCGAYAVRIADRSALPDTALVEKIKRKRRKELPAALPVLIGVDRAQAHKMKLGLLEQEWAHRGHSPLP